MQWLLFLTIHIFITVISSKVDKTNTKSALRNLTIEIVHKPTECGRSSQPGDLVSFHYRTTLVTDGSLVDSSYDQGKPLQFQLGVGAVLKAWDDGLVDMCVGEKRKLISPPYLAWGKDGAGDRVPPESDVLFEVEMVKIETGPKHANLFKEIDANGNGELTKFELEAYFDGKFLKHQTKQNPENAVDLETVKSQTIAEAFKRDDLNHDGIITYWEFGGPKVDRDGSIKKEHSQTKDRAEL